MLGAKFLEGFWFLGQNSTVKYVEFLEGDFEDDTALVHDGNNALRSDGAAPVPLESPRLIEASVERSNVRPVEELAALVEIQRGFDIVMRSLQADAELRQRLLQEISS